MFKIVFQLFIGRTYLLVIRLDTELNREDRIFDMEDENERIKQDLSRIHEKRSQLEKELTLTCDKILSTREEYKRSQRYNIHFFYVDTNVRLRQICIFVYV